MHNENEFPKYQDISIIKSNVKRQRMHTLFQVPEVQQVKLHSQLDLLYHPTGNSKEQPSFTEISECISPLATRKNDLDAKKANDSLPDTLKVIQEKMTSKVAEHEMPSLSDRKELVNELAQRLTENCSLLLVDKTVWHYEAPLWHEIKDREEFAFFVYDFFNGTEFTDFFDSGFVNAILYRVKSLIKERLHPSDFMPDVSTLCLRDNVIRITDGQVIPANSGYRHTTSINVLSKDFHSSSGSTFEAFLNNATGGDAAARELILEVIGTLLAPERVKKFFSFYGPANTGKSVLIDLIRYIIGREHTATIRDINRLGTKFQGAFLIGKQICACPDAPAVKIGQNAISMIKMMTGDSSVEVENKGKDPIQISGVTKLLVGSNHRLKAESPQQEDAFFKRMIEIPFQNPIPPEEQDHQLIDKLQQEVGYVVRVALDALIKLRANNYIYTEVTHISNKTLYNGLLRKPLSERVWLFIKQCCDQGDNLQISTDEFFNAFQDFCEANRWPTATIATVGKAVSSFTIEDTASPDYGRPLFEKTRINNTYRRGYKGLALKQISSDVNTPMFQ